MITHGYTLVPNDSLLKEVFSGSVSIGSGKTYETALTINITGQLNIELGFDSYGSDSWRTKLTITSPSGQTQTFYYWTQQTTTDIFNISETGEYTFTVSYDFTTGYRYLKTLRLLGTTIGGRVFGGTVVE